MTPTLVFDIDGVLADFVRGAMRAHGAEGKIPFHKVRWEFPEDLGFKSASDPNFWAPLDRGFWSSLRPLHDGIALLAAAEVLVGEENIILLSNPGPNDGAYDGKRDWVKKHLPRYKKRLFVGEEKFRLAWPTSVLLDDSDTNILDWMKTGAPAVLIPRPWNQFAYRADMAGKFNVLNEQENLAALVREIRGDT